MTTLKKSETVPIPRSDKLVADYQACGLNSVITYLESVGEIGKADVEELKELFSYDEEGISDEKNRWRRLNNKLKEWKVPYSFNYRRYTGHQELLGALHKQGPVPVFFRMSVLHFTQKHYRDLEYQLQIGDVFDTEVKHVLILVGVNNDGDLLFIDPSYQLPFLSRQVKDTSKYYFPLSKKDFYQSAKFVKAFLEVTHEKHLAKKYKKELQKERDQTKLVK